MRDPSRSTGCTCRLVTICGRHSRESLEALGLEVGSEVEVVVDEDQRRLILRPAEDLPGVDAEFSRRLEDFIDRHRPALAALADGQVRYLSPEPVLCIHHVLTEGAGLRDAGALQVASGRPRSGFGDEAFSETVFDMAAAFLHSLLENHPLVDAPERTAITAAEGELTGGTKSNGVPLRRATPRATTLSVPHAESDAWQPPGRQCRDRPAPAIPGRTRPRL